MISQDQYLFLSNAVEQVNPCYNILGELNPNFQYSNIANTDICERLQTSTCIIITSTEQLDKKSCVCETQMPPAATKSNFSKNLFVLYFGLGA